MRVVLVEYILLYFNFLTPRWGIGSHNLEEIKQPRRSKDQPGVNIGWSEEVWSVNMQLFLISCVISRQNWSYQLWECLLDLNGPSKFSVITLFVDNPCNRMGQSARSISVPSNLSVKMAILSHLWHILYQFPNYLQPCMIRDHSSCSISVESR